MSNQLEYLRVYSSSFDIIFLILYMFLVPKMLHIMQQESYQNDGMIRWLGRNLKKAFKKSLIGLLLCIAIFMLSTLGLQQLLQNGVIKDANKYYALIPTVIAFTFMLIYNIVVAIQDHKERKNAKKPLKYTSRAKRLMFYNFLIVTILIVFLIEATGIKYESTVMFAPLIYSFLIFTLPINMIISNWFVSPIEYKIGEHYMTKAYRKLNQKEYKNLIRIGITGSYGKTSTKFILKTILSEKYNVLATPGSFNTSMGNVRVIREQLKPEHEIFISEMGARKKNDINEICEFVNPHIGIITSIGPQHLETFKSIENVAKTKGELLNGVFNKKTGKGFSYRFDSAFSIAKAALSPSTYGLGKNADKEEEVNKFTQDGAIFLPKDGAYCEELYNKDSHENKFLFGVEDKLTDVYAKDIKVDENGSTFTVVSKINGTYDCKTRLLGEHNVQNIIGAIAIAEYLELDKNQIRDGVEKIEPVEHRLQLLPSTNGTIVIDDAFNSNPVGSKAALDVISQFKGRKIIITPGMVELGTEEDKYNKEFGKQMAKAVDIAILVGQNHTKPIQEGLKEAGFDDMSIYVVGSLDDATAKLAKITKVGDVILFENDLPDSYNE
ncbi:MAG: UDP-N-acetylmuramoyl-tripeptide--D-alanyl-D-alanine ligase [Clostridia bacterium]|nr:UDP-N-acetylmuramoyl-tripeptide--D-alanyl-D-alanine ligase [Clostridia bacterium]